MTKSKCRDCCGKNYSSHNALELRSRHALSCRTPSSSSVKTTITDGLMTLSEYACSFSAKSSFLFLKLATVNKFPCLGKFFVTTVRVSGNDDKSKHLLNSNFASSHYKRFFLVGVIVVFCYFFLLNTEE